MLSREIVWLDPTTIQVELKDRQRQQELDCSDLIPSVRERGVMLPLLVEEETLRLLAGWRRLTSAIFCDKPEVPVRFVPKGVGELELQRIEWEENAKRKDLVWQDNAKAQWRLHNLSLERDPNWTVEQTAGLLSQSFQHTHKMLDLGEALAEGDETIASADSAAQATTILQRRRARASGEALNRILEIDLDDEEDAEPGVDPGEDGDILPGGGGAEPASEGAPPAAVPANRLPRADRIVAPPYSIISVDCHEFLADYAGPKFNFLHCDLPYGVKLNGQAGQGAFEQGYDSDPDIYWKLCRSLVANWDKYLYPSSHVMFWISMKFYRETVEFFEDCAGNSTCPLPSDLRINPTPLVWHKTDNRGIIADHLRGPRNVYEAALIMSTGDRHLVRPTSNVYGCPTVKGDDAIHSNEKPEPMLKYFFQMFVDQHSRVLDPTCGSGSSIRAAEALRAEAALGLEFNPDLADLAQKKLMTARGLANLSKIISSSSPVDSSEEVM